MLTYAIICYYGNAGTDLLCLQLLEREGFVHQYPALQEFHRAELARPTTLILQTNDPVNGFEQCRTLDFEKSLDCTMSSVPLAKVPPSQSVLRAAHDE